MPPQSVVTRSKEGNPYFGPSFAIPALFLICGTLYFRSLGYGFLDFDDPTHILQNPLVARPSLANLGAIWGQGFFGLYIPVTYSFWLMVSWLSQRVGFSNGAALFHAANVLVHCAVCCGVYLLLRRVFEREWRHSSQNEMGAFFAALYFALHPTQVESVCWISAMRDLLSTLFVISSFILVQRGREGLATLTYSLALLSKPSAIVAVPLLATIDLNRGLTSQRNLALLWAVIGVVPVLITMKLQGVLIPRHTAAWPMRPMVALDAIGFYVVQVFWPVTFLLDYSRKPEAALLHSFVTWIHIALALALLVWSCLKSTPKLIRWGVIVFVLGLFPNSGLLSFSFQNFSTVADHYMYLPLLGLSVVLVELFRRSKARPKQTLAFALTVAIILFARSWVQSEVWRDSERLFEATLAKNPMSLIAQTNLAYVLEKRGKFPESLVHLRAAVGIAPELLPLRMNLVEVENIMGNGREVYRNLVIAKTQFPQNQEVTRQLQRWVAKNKGDS